MEILKWIQEWYSSNCDGDWEHEYGVKIDTIDNPGWLVRIDLIGTNLEGKKTSWVLFEKSELDWWGFAFKGDIYEGSGDPGKLTTILKKFKSFVELDDQMTLS